MTEQLQEMKARLEAATPGPWKVDGMDSGHSRYEMDLWITAGDAGDVVCSMDGLSRATLNERTARDDGRADADFIAHAPEAQAKLIAAWEAVEAYMVEQERRTAFPDADAIDRPYSLGRRHSYDAVRAVFREALA